MRLQAALLSFTVLDASWTVKCAVNDPLLHRCAFLRVGSIRVGYNHRFSFIDKKKY